MFIVQLFVLLYDFITNIYKTRVNTRYKPAAFQQKFLRKYPVYTLVTCNLNYGVNNSDSDKYFSINGNNISLVKEYSHLGHIVTSDLDDRTDRAH